MYDNIRAFLVDSCDIQRADVRIDATTIKDRRVAKYDTVSAGVKCWFEPGSTSYDYGDLVGQQPVESFTVYFVGKTDVRAGDRLKNLKNLKYYIVKGIQDYSSQGMHITCQTTEMSYAMGT
jgi:hypothetical protein